MATQCAHVGQDCTTRAPVVLLHYCYCALQDTYGQRYSEGHDRYGPPADRYGELKRLWCKFTQIQWGCSLV